MTNNTDDFTPESLAAGRAQIARVAPETIAALDEWRDEIGLLEVFLNWLADNQIRLALPARPDDPNAPIAPEGQVAYEVISDPVEMAGRTLLWFFGVDPETIEAETKLIAQLMEASAAIAMGGEDDPVVALRLAADEMLA